MDAESAHRLGLRCAINITVLPNAKKNEKYCNLLICALKGTCQMPQFCEKEKGCNIVKRVEDHTPRMYRK